MLEEYLLSTVNGLTNNANVSDPTKRDVFSAMFVRMMEKYEKSAVFKTYAVFGGGYHIYYGTVF